ncbi:MAG: DUF2824 family protein, partial [Desulfofustis sp.]|nr:DUF2824 family protein [Desulfofustis sp.]
MRRCDKKDLNWLTAMMLDSHIFGACSEDGMTKHNTRAYVAKLLSNPNIIVLTPAPGKMIHTFQIHTRVMAEVHTAIRKNCGISGKDKVAMSRKAAEYMVTKHGIRKFITYVPEGNRAGGLYARMCGMERVGVLTSSISQGGKLRDMTLYQS